MDPENMDGSEVLETTEEVAEETTSTEETPEKIELTKQELEELRHKALERDELEKKNKQLFARINKQKEQPAAQDGLSNRDVLFLAKADIHEDDLDTVLEWAKFKKVTVAEAYKQMKPTLDVNAQMRATAAATQVKGSARGASKVSGTEILARAERTGEVPESAEALSELFMARTLKRLGKK